MSLLRRLFGRKRETYDGESVESHRFLASESLHSQADDRNSISASVEETCNKNRREKPWQRSAVESAIGSVLLPDDVMWCQSELDVPSPLLPYYRLGKDLGRAAAGGTLFYDLHPGNAAFNGEIAVIFDWGEVKQVNVSAHAFLPWLADARATWGRDFEGLLAGFLMGVRGASATSNPLLYPELVWSIGGKPRGVPPPWPLRPEMAATFDQVCIFVDNCFVYADLQRLAAVPMDDSERSALDDLAQLLGTDLTSLRRGSVKIAPNLGALRGLVNQRHHDESSLRRLWLLSFMLTKLGHLFSQYDVTVAVQLMQAGQIVLQGAAGQSRFFEALMAFCVHAEPNSLLRPTHRRQQQEIFGIIAYISSFSVTFREFFRNSVNLMGSNDIDGALWSLAWDSLLRIRACQAAFVQWASGEANVYAAAAPGLLMMTRAQGSIICEIINGVVAANNLSVSIPWVLALEKSIPNIKSEFEWCEHILAIDSRSDSFAAQLTLHYSKLSASVDASHLGISDISFVGAVN